MLKQPGIGVVLRASAKKKNSKNPRLLWKWVGPRLTRNFFVGKSSQNHPKPVLICWSSIPCVCCLSIAKSCWLLLFECSVHVSDGFQKKVWMEGGWMGRVSSKLYPIFLGFF